MLYLNSYLYSIKQPNPTLNELKIFFNGSPHWLLLAGHFDGNVLYNEDKSTMIEFMNDRVKLSFAEGADVELKKPLDFSLHQSCEVVLWGGCSVCSLEDTMQMLRTLFGQHVLLGFAGLTGWKIVDAMLGGGFIRNHFFERVKGHISNPVMIRDAWMETARNGYGGSSLETHFRAIDPDGQEWKLDKKAIVKGRLIS